MARVRPDVTGAVLIDGVYLDLDHDRDWPDDHPAVGANPWAFTPTPKPKPRKR